jgi:hypothetical protein
MLFHVAFWSRFVGPGYFSGAIAKSPSSSMRQLARKSESETGFIADLSLSHFTKLNLEDLLHYQL